MASSLVLPRAPGARRAPQWRGRHRRRRRLQELAARIDDVPDPTGRRHHRTKSPSLDELFDAVDGDLINLTLAFGPLGLKTWPEPEARSRIGLDALNELEKDLPSLLEARKRVRWECTRWSSSSSL
jgi:hypothetical protein